ncbi:MAG: glycosyl transferase family 8 [Devosia sp.]|nr:glycosyl transferase family 8 [Devosia sp.]
MSLGPIFFCCDEGYAAPLATALRSLAEANMSNWPLDIRVLVDASGDWTRKVQASLPEGAAIIRWHRIELEAFRKFPTNRHISASTFGRLFIEQFVTAEDKRALYLDADILVLGSLEDLWRADLGDNTLGAVRDNFDNDLKFGKTPLPETKAAPRVTDYFNAGVLLIDLARWRERRVVEKAFAYLQNNPNTPFADQDALNVACDGEWNELGKHWNSVDFVEKINLARTPDDLRPGIVHFAARVKPWNFAYWNQNAGFYDKVRDRTLFRRTFAMRQIDRLLRLWGPSRRTLGQFSRTSRLAAKTLFSRTQKA